MSFMQGGFFEFLLGPIFGTLERFLVWEVSLLIVVLLIAEFVLRTLLPASHFLRVGLTLDSFTRQRCTRSEFRTWSQIHYAPVAIHDFRDAT